MANEIVLRKALPIGTLNELIKAGELLGSCKMLGCANPAEGFIVATTCFQEGLTFLDFSNKFDIIEGKPRKKAETMLAELRQRGGNYAIQQRNVEGVKILFSYAGNTYLSELTWKDIENEPYTRAGKDEFGKPYTPNVPLEKRRFKDNWATPRRRMQMMWARCVSDGVRVICPEVTQGMYTPEEAADFDSDAAAKPIPIQPIQPIQQQAQENVAAPIPLGNVLAQDPATPFDAPIVVAAPPISSPIAPVATPAPTLEAESPFVSPAAAGSVCHIQGQYYGMSWHLVPTDYCRTLLASAFVDGLTDDDRKFIKDSLEQRGVL